MIFVCGMRAGGAALGASANFLARYLVLRFLVQRDKRFYPYISSFFDPETIKDLRY